MTKCNKKPFATRKDAKRFKRFANTMKRMAGGVTSIYYCEQCSNYHLTTKPKDTRVSFRKQNLKNKNNQK